MTEIVERRVPRQPYDFAEAVAACRRASEAQRQGEELVRESSKTLAKKEEDYRLALALKIGEVHASGAAWTVAQDLARGDKYVARLRYERDVAKGVFEAAQQRGWRHTADRKDTLEFVQWSRRVAPDGQGHEDPNAEPVTFGRRAA